MSSLVTRSSYEFFMFMAHIEFFLTISSNVLPMTAYYQTYPCVLFDDHNFLHTRRGLSDFQRPSEDHCVKSLNLSVKYLFLSSWVVLHDIDISLKTMKQKPFRMLQIAQ